jgi:predicted MPP superfamily phosphohydrolase
MDLLPAIPLRVHGRRPKLAALRSAANRDRSAMLTRRQFLQIGAGAIALGASGAAYAVEIEPRFRLVHTHWHVPHPHWPTGSTPLRITVLTDIHASDPYMPVARIEKIVESANALGSDLIVLLGDFVAGGMRYVPGGAPVPIADWAPVLAQLRAPLGVFAIFGNHDWWSNIWEVRDGLQQYGIGTLENRAVRLGDERRRFWLAGLGDQLALHTPRGYKGVDDLPGTLAQLSGDEPVILLAHEPDVFVRVPDRVTLTLSGHTHGGQVWLPFLGRPVIPSRYGQRFAYGHIVEDGRHLIVSSGLGVTGLPIRFMVPPEIAVVTLTAPAAA